MLSAASAPSLRRKVALLVVAAIAAAALAACDGGDDDDVDEPTPTQSAPAGPPPTIPVPPTFDPRTSTPSPDDFIGVVTMDSNSDTPEIDHDDVVAAVGETFEIGIVVNAPPGGYRGYQVGIAWDDNEILVYEDEAPLMPANMMICAPIEALLDGTLTAGRTGVYGGCLNQDGEVTFEGLVTVLTFRCAQAGRIGLRPLSLNESMSLGTSLISGRGMTFAEQVDNGFDVVCE